MFRHRLSVLFSRRHRLRTCASATLDGVPFGDLGRLFVVLLSLSYFFLCLSSPFLLCKIMKKKKEYFLVLALNHLVYFFKLSTFESKVEILLSRESMLDWMAALFLAKLAST